ncbi:sodium:calcium antiporter [Sphingomonas crocodyli]|uniref:Sodium:calcium antiporter n=1 Tax=Sphingomonas crocodyli TaxID=1979270 RepID=A0A437LYK8_9SPHN|nr:sodium:calcium antiporter [Sphingomonas crocodyli]RVT90501.1 sodium:calcium antiporter [Sphingomonas crocodyli]
MPLADAVSYPLWMNIAIFLVGAAVVWWGGGNLARSLDEIASRTGMSHALVGMLFLGGITSLPEVANVVTASAMGNPPLAINNLLGSAAINIVLLAVADAFVGRDAVTSVVAKPSTMMMGTLCMLVLIAVALAVIVGDIPVAGTIGLGSILICTLSIAFFVLAAGHDARSPWVLANAGERHDPEPEPTGSASLLGLSMQAALAALAIFVAGYALSQTGDALAQQTGLGSGLVGFLLIGFATSMPELSSIIASLKLRRYEMAFGQVLGTNFVNLSLLLLADIVYKEGAVIAELGRFEMISALLGAILTGIFLVGLLEHRNRTILRMGYDSAAVLLVFCGGVTLLWQTM